MCNEENEKTEESCCSEVEKELKSCCKQDEKELESCCMSSEDCSCFDESESLANYMEAEESIIPADDIDNFEENNSCCTNKNPNFINYIVFFTLLIALLSLTAYFGSLSKGAPLSNPTVQEPSKDVSKNVGAGPLSYSVQIISYKSSKRAENFISKWKIDSEKPYIVKRGKYYSVLVNSSSNTSAVDLKLKIKKEMKLNARVLKNSFDKKHYKRA